MKAPQLRIPPLSAIAPRFSTVNTCQLRWASKRATPAIPQPVPLVPDVPTLLKVLGRGLSQYAEKFPTWNSLFTSDSTQMKELGIEPPRTRRYLLAWLERYRQGALGPGGDFKHVENGEAYLQVATTEAQDRKWVINVPAGQKADGAVQGPDERVRGYQVRGASAITGPYALPLKAGDGAKVQVVEGMWEHRQGIKVDGGERRRTEVRYKKRIAQRKAEIEASRRG
ncbi:Protein FYV4 like protein [Verticillium longisporum]|uniref:Small ribosomal subunit protein mS41 n=1 Tax=Verticillium longisporum TaxID=100787 RepID=A0A8I3AJR3_VERLO|nr:Protein FYV4 like protein [Verticillium longisporum]